MNRETQDLNTRLRASLSRIRLDNPDAVAAVQALAECPNTYCNLPYSHYGPCRIIRAD